MTGRLWTKQQASDFYDRDRNSTFDQAGFFWATKNGGCCQAEIDQGTGTIYVMKESSFREPWAHFVIGETPLWDPSSVGGGTYYNIAERNDDPGYWPGRCP